ncbi:replication initiator protein [robinz microvirus RP_139]|nr:replication initiator protein [robinz microvirus RP_139]
MFCKNPIGINQTQYVACGQCLPCRIGKRMLWASRIKLEATQHHECSFLTLTYTEENVPGDGSLNPLHLSHWLKRFRKRYEPLRVRYFAVGEYGDVTWRPHYHVVLFGFGGCRLGRQFLDVSERCCPNCNMVSETWGLGRIECVPFDPRGHSNYVAGYVVKKMTKKEDSRLEGKYPEFARMSRSPGLGAHTAPAIADAMRRGFREYTEDVPHYLSVGVKEKLTLGRYIRGRVREELGMAKETPARFRQDFQEKMLDLSLYAQQMGLTPKEVLQIKAEQRTSTAEFWEKLRRKKPL